MVEVRIEEMFRSERSRPLDYERREPWSSKQRSKKNKEDHSSE